MKTAKTIAIALAATFSVAASAYAAQPSFSLRTLERGEWTLRDKADDFRLVRKLCVRDPRVLVKLHHPGQRCEIHRLSGDAREVVFSYSCQSGSGSTAIRRETDRLVQIRSQGLDRGAPYAFDYEARKTGSC